jgi:dipeptidase E
MNNGILFLTSTGLSCNAITEKLKLIFIGRTKGPVAIVTTAAEGKENNKYSQLAKKQFSDLGFEHSDFVDLETESNKDFSRYEVIYVCGGNTFKLLKFAREANFKSSIENLLKRNGIYIGVSAGSIIVGPSITITGEVAADHNEVGLEDFTGFGITDLIILPHYSPEIEKEVVVFENKYSVKVERISNSQAIIIENGEKTLVE